MVEEALESIVERDEVAAVGRNLEFRVYSLSWNGRRHRRTGKRQDIRSLALSVICCSDRCFVPSHSNS